MAMLACTEEEILVERVNRVGVIAAPSEPLECVHGRASRKKRYHRPCSACIRRSCCSCAVQQRDRLNHGRGYLQALGARIACGRQAAGSRLPLPV